MIGVYTPLVVCRSNAVGPRLIDKIDNESAARKALPIDHAAQSHRHTVLAISHGST
ncbi:MAG TPA: hypothetical protein VHX39_17755 [Acetobacteraceae bacterium]|jgi:hypothetical protein|nr:hypothetical protein [Acetobacteraceae bacterium]